MSETQKPNPAGVPNVAERISAAKALAKTGGLSEALENLLALEKACRLNAEIETTVGACEAIIDVCFESGDFKQLNDHILIISKRRSQMKQAVIKVVQMCMTYLDRDPSPLSHENTVELIETLRAVSAGKMFLELERARLTRRLAGIREAEGKIDEASDVLQEIAPETHGTMDRKEKVEFILEQMRLCLTRKDYIRAGVIANKISERSISGEGLEELKIRYHQQMIQLFHNSKKYLAISKAYHAIYSCPSVQQNETRCLETLKRVVVFLLLAPFNNEQSDFLARMKLEKKRLDNIPEFSALVRLFSTFELISWPFAPTIATHLNEGSALWDDAFVPSLAEDMHKRVVEHNIRVIAKYYRRIRTERLAQLLCLEIDEMERSVSDLVTSGSVWARIDRVGGVVVFQKPENTADILNKWANDVDSLLSTLETTCHLIRKENVLYGIKA